MFDNKNYYKLRTEEMDGITYYLLRQFCRWSE